MKHKCRTDFTSLAGETYEEGRIMTENDWNNDTLTEQEKEENFDELTEEAAAETTV